MIDRETIINNAVELAGTPQLKDKCEIFYYELLEEIYTQYPHIFTIKGYTGTLLQGGFYLSQTYLPDDFLFEYKIVVRDSDNNKYRLPKNIGLVEEFVTGHQPPDKTGRPEAYTVVKQSGIPNYVMYFYPKADKNYSIDIGYFTIDQTYVPPISKALTNGLIARCLMYDNDDRAVQFLQLYKAGLEEFFDSAMGLSKIDNNLYNKLDI